MRDWIKNESIFGGVKGILELSGNKTEKVLIIGNEKGGLESYLEADVKEVHGIEKHDKIFHINNEFDVVIFNNVVHNYVGSTLKVLEEAWRILKTNGKVVIWEDIPMAPKVFSDYASYVCSFEDRLVFNREDIQKLFIKFDGFKIDELVLRQQSVDKMLSHVDENSKKLAISRLMESSANFKHNIGFYVNPYVEDDISFDIRIAIGRGTKSIKDGMFNSGWWDGPDRYQNVNRNIIGQCQRKTFFQVVSKLAPGPIGVDLGGPGFDENGVKVYGFNIVSPSRSIQGDAIELPFKDNSIDFFLSSHTIEHIKDVPKAMREWIRALKPGGLIAFTMPDVRHFVHSNDPSIEDADLAPSEMTSLQMKEILEQIPEAEILLFDTQHNNFDFDGLIRKRS